jgi:hypothetical protein
MFAEPCLSVFDTQRLSIACGLLRGNGLIVDIDDRGKVVSLRESNYHMSRLIKAT